MTHSLKKSTVAVLTWVTSAILAAAFAGLYFSTRFSSSVSSILVPVALVVPPAFVSVVALLLNKGAGRLSSVLAAATPFTLVAGGLGAFMTVDGNLARVLIACTALGLTSLYLAYWHGMGGGDYRYRNDDFAHLSFVVHVVAMFFVLGCVFGMSDFVSVPTPAVVAVVGILAFVTAAETFRRAGVRPPALMPVSLSVAALMTEVTAALAQLPTTNLVNAMVGVVLFASFIHATIAILIPESRPPAFMRHFALSAAIVILVLSTAQWA